MPCRQVDLRPSSALLCQCGIQLLMAGMPGNQQTLAYASLRLTDWLAAEQGSEARSVLARPEQALLGLNFYGYDYALRNAVSGRMCTRVFYGESHT